MGRRILLLLAVGCITALAQQSKSFPEHVGNIGVNRIPADWSSPEDLLRNLRSDNNALRIHAGQLLGASKVSFEEGGAEETGFQYFSRGAAGVPIAIVTAKKNGFNYAAVAAQASGKWTRLAVFECWCKYDNDPGFISIAWAPLSQEIKLGSEPIVVTVRAVGGGTGEYEQTEAWFALRNDQLEDVISFASRKRSCQLESPCYSLRRWFDGRQMIEGRNDRLRNTKAAMNPDLEIRDFKSFACTPYKWDNASFRYVPSGPAKPCATKTQ